MKKLGFIIGIIVLLMAVMPLGVPVSNSLPAQAAEPPVPVPTEPPSLPPPQGEPPPVIDGHGTGALAPTTGVVHISEEALSDGSMAGGAPVGQPPTSFDWRAPSNKVTSVKNQGVCGACYAFAGIANVESRVLIDTNTTPPGPDYSENNAKECNWREINGWVDGLGRPWGSCDGGNYKILASLFSQKGIVDEANDPYQALDVACNSSCPYNKTLLDWRIISTYSVPNTTLLKNYIWTEGPIYTHLFVGDDSTPAWRDEFATYDGSYCLYYPYTYDPNHAVLIVGWNDTLPHAGGTGCWIVKNSWDTTWGDNGYFTIAYGSAMIGSWASYMYDWQDYDNSGSIYYYDDDCQNDYAGYSPSLTAWGLCNFTPSSNTYATRVEFWTVDTTTDIDVYIYDDFNVGTKTLSTLLASELNYNFSEPGYHGVNLSSPVALTAGDPVIVVVNFTDASWGWPVPTDQYGPWVTNLTYISPDGTIAGNWFEMGNGLNEDVAIRLRTSGEWEGEWYWKEGNFTDYALSGMPDFDQRQDAWTNPMTGNWSYCGPVAEANSLWYFDSREEPTPVPPPTVNDNYSLVTSYGAWDDHATQNVEPLVNELAWLMDTDGQRTGTMHGGTDVMDFQWGIDKYLVNRSFYGYYYERTVPKPDFFWIEDEIERCEDVVLLLGFWQDQYGDWVRVGGHYVTCAGVNSSAMQLGICDPFFDNAETGGPGRVLPAVHPPHPGDHTVHNDTEYVSHDIYNVTLSDCPGGPWALQNYTDNKSILKFIGQNWAPDLNQWNGSYFDWMPVVTQIDYAVAVSPKEDLNGMIDSDYEMDEVNVSIRVHVTDEDWNNTIYDMDVLFWSNETGTVWANHTDFVDPLQYCQNYTFNVSFGFYPPEIVVLHFSDEDDENIGFAFSESAEGAPDLIVEDKFEEVAGCQYWVYYTVLNNGTAPAGNSTTCIYANDKEVATRPCPALLVGESYSDSVGPLDCPGDTIVIIEVCADNYSDVVESNEDNNCLENDMYQPLEFGDAPDPTYPSLLASDGARHCPVYSEILGLNSQGDCKDFELDAQITDLDTCCDGLVTTTLDAGNATATVQFEVTNFNTINDLIVNILIDLNIDGDWTDLGEHVVQNQAINLSDDEGTFVSDSFSTVNATVGQTWLRLTLTRTPVTVPWDGTGLFACGETEDWKIYIEGEVPEEWYWKPGNFTDYALSGMPDFDQKQDGWFDPTSGKWTFCGPVAVANSLWYFDSREEPSPVPPPDINDNYYLVTSYNPGVWDDHDPQNVEPLVNDLAALMNTNPSTGTNVFDMQDGIEDYLNATGYADDYYEVTVEMPEFEWIEAEVERCEDVILLLGFWQTYDDPYDPMAYWWRIGGHYVTCAGVNSNASMLGICDPYFDNAEAGGQGIVPVPHPAHPGDPTVHNDTQYVSHDIYGVTPSPSPGGIWGLEGYAWDKDPVEFYNFEGQNGDQSGPYEPGVPIFTEIEYAVAVSPVTGATLQGNVDLKRKAGASWVTGLVVSFFDPSTNLEAGFSPKYATTDENGNFTVTGVGVGTWDVGVKNWTCLSRMSCGENFTIGNTTTINFVGKLTESDTDNDDRIKLVDFNRILNNFGAEPGDAGWDPNYDFDRSGKVDLVDFNLVLNNFGGKGDIYDYPPCP